ncbi:MAG: hypothetical protein PVF10_14570, partial [Syntrophobacterales bacterium]
MLRLEREEKGDAEWMAALRMNNTLTEIDLAADLYEMLSTVDNRRTLNHIRCVLACLTIEMMLLYPAKAWELAMDEYVQKYSMSLWRHLQDEDETWINMKNPQKDQFWEKRLKIMNMNHMDCFYEMMRRYDHHTLQDCSDIVRILGTVIEYGEDKKIWGDQKELKDPKVDRKKELFKQLADRQARHRDKDAFSQAIDGARLRERRDPKIPHGEAPIAPKTAKDKWKGAFRKVQAAKAFGLEEKQPPVGARQAKQMKTAWQAPAGTFLEDSDILAPPQPPGEEEEIRKGEHWKRRTHRLGGGIASFLTFDSSIVAIMDEVFGLQRGADISGTTTDHIAVITLAKDWIEQRRKGSKEMLPYEELNQYIALCDKQNLLPKNDAQWNLLQMVPLATMPFAQHHTILEIALPLSFKKIIDYRIGYYSTLMPIVCKPGQDKVADNVGRLLTWYEHNRYHAVFVVKPTKEGAPVTRKVKVGKEKVDVDGKFGGYEPELAYIMEDDHEKG